MTTCLSIPPVSLGSPVLSSLYLMYSVWVSKSLYRHDVRQMTWRQLVNHLHKVKKKRIKDLKLKDFTFWNIHHKEAPFTCARFLLSLRMSFGQFLITKWISKLSSNNSKPGLENLLKALLISIKIKSTGILLSFAAVLSSLVTKFVKYKRLIIQPCCFLSKRLFILNSLE